MVPLIWESQESDPRRVGIRPQARHAPCGCVSWAGMTKRPRSAVTATPATDLSTPERVLLFCVASDTEWKRAGILVVIDRDYPDQIDVEVVHKALMIGDAGGVHGRAVPPASSASARALMAGRRAAPRSTESGCGLTGSLYTSGVFGADAVREPCGDAKRMRCHYGRVPGRFASPST
jgi:hypothetical protein